LGCEIVLQVNISDGQTQVKRRFTGKLPGQICDKNNTVSPILYCQVLPRSAFKDTMEIKSFTPQTQRFLARMDYNQDDKLSARELGILAKIPSAPGIDPKDLLTIQAELKKAKGPETIIVSLVDEASLPPGYKPPAPIFSETPALRQGSGTARKAPSASAADSAPAPSGAKEAEKKKGKPGPAETSPLASKPPPKSRPKMRQPLPACPPRPCPEPPVKSKKSRAWMCSPQPNWVI
jgi:hypothetical protein